MWRQIGVLTAALAAAATMPSVARPAAAQMCGQNVIRAWSDGTLGPTYAVPCYEWALGHLPPDVEGYSSAPDDIQRELLAAVRRRASATHGVLGASVVRTHGTGFFDPLPVIGVAAGLVLAALGAVAFRRRRHA